MRTKKMRMRIWMKIWEKIRTRGGNNAALRKTHRIRTEEE